LRAAAASTNAIPVEPIRMSPDIFFGFGMFWAHTVGTD
jgi:hypothetical protein